MSFHEVEILGNLGGDPSLRYLDSGTAVSNFSVAANRQWTDNDGNKQEQVTWFRITVWARMAEACHEYLSKGRQVFVKGRMNPDENGGPRIWTGDDGVARASYEVTARLVKFVGGRSNGNGGGQSAPQESPGDSIPF